MFNGPEYNPERDNARLINQIDRILALMLDGTWRTLQEISDITFDPSTSVSAQLRHLRKDRFGAYTVNRRSKGKEEKGLFEYQVQLPKVGDIKTKKKTKEDVVAALDGFLAHQKMLSLSDRIDVKEFLRGLL